MIAAHGPRGLALAAAHGDGVEHVRRRGVRPAGAGGVLAPARRRSPPSSPASAKRAGRDPASVRRSVLLGYGTVQPLADVASYVAAVERAEADGFDEVVVYWPDGERGDRFWSDPDVHAEALTRLAH